VILPSGLSRENLARRSEKERRSKPIPLSPNQPLAAALLAAPFLSLFLLFRLGFEPSLGSFPTLLQVSESHLSSFIVFGAFLLLLAAFFVSGYSVIQIKKAGKRLTDDPINLLLALATLLVIILVISAIVVDQYPCWIGVPNCD
jgi:uncharacterized membrane protein YidH (DUF202 family)